MASDDDDDERDEPTPTSRSPEIVDAIFDEQRARCCTRRRTRRRERRSRRRDDGDDDEDDDGDDDDDDGDGDPSSRATGATARRRSSTSVPFPIERYPEIIDDYDCGELRHRAQARRRRARRRGIGHQRVLRAVAVGLPGRARRGVRAVPARRRRPRSPRTARALMWVERFAVPATAARSGPLPAVDRRAAARDPADRVGALRRASTTRVKARASGDDGDPFVLAGNPFADRFRAPGRRGRARVGGRRRARGAGASSPACSSRSRSSTIPTIRRRAPIAERLLRRALSFDPASDAAGYLAIVLVRQHRVAEAIALARDGAEPRRAAARRSARSPSTRPASSRRRSSCSMRDARATTPPEELAELVASIARHAPAHLAALLARLPDDVALVPHLYNASFSVDRPQALADPAPRARAARAGRATPARRAPRS